MSCWILEMLLLIGFIVYGLFAIDLIFEMLLLIGFVI